MGLKPECAWLGIGMQSARLLCSLAPHLLVMIVPHLERVFLHWKKMIVPHFCGFRHGFNNPFLCGFRHAALSRRYVVFSVEPDCSLGPHLGMGEWRKETDFSISTL